MSVKIIQILVFLSTLFAQNIFAVDCSSSALCGCSLSTTGINFGSFIPYDYVPVKVATNLVVTCSVDSIDPGSSYDINYSITFGNGSYGNASASRTMQKSSEVLNYNLYADLGYSQIFGSGFNGTVTITNTPYSLAPGEHQTDNYVIYGRIPAGQQLAEIGTYNDTITISLTYQ